MIENAIPVCFNCHADIGHYNPRHPRGTKFSPDELRGHRDRWWARCAADAVADREMAVGLEDHPPISAEFEVIAKEVGLIWTNWAHEDAATELVTFRGYQIASLRRQDQSGISWYELYLVKDRRFLVYKKHIKGTDNCVASLVGRDPWPDCDVPMFLGEVQELYPELATEAGLRRRRVLRF